MKIVVDAMGGDFAPSEVVKGALEAASNDPDIELILTGNETQIKESILKSTSDIPVSIHHTEQIVEMTDRPSHVIKLKPNSLHTTARPRPVLRAVPSTIIPPLSICFFSKAFFTM